MKEQKKICGIYKITNLINGKVYIGQSKDIYRRWQQHQNSYKRMSEVVYKAMRKYGIDNFTFQKIEECLEKELDEREMFYIQFYHSYIGENNSNGYNMSLGGSGQNGWGVPVEQYSLNGEYIAEYQSIEEASKTTNVKSDSIVNCCAGRRKSAGKYIWIYKGDKKPNLYCSNLKIVPVSQYDFNGNYITSYKTATEAAKAVGANKSQIVACCKGNSKSCFGYQWRYKEENFNEKYEYRDTTPVVQYSLKGEYINKFPSRKEASVKTQTPIYLIHESCRKEKSRGGNFLWRNENDNPPLPYEEFTNKRAVLQYFLDGKLKHKYNSLKEAMESIGVSSNANICACCKGKRNTAYGYKWKYVD